MGPAPSFASPMAPLTVMYEGGGGVGMGRIYS